jgi:hypothetical protein
MRDSRTVARKSSSGFEATSEGAWDFHKSPMLKSVRSTRTTFSRSLVKVFITSSLLAAYSPNLSFRNKILVGCFKRSVRFS